MVSDPHAFRNGRLRLVRVLRIRWQRFLIRAFAELKTAEQKVISILDKTARTKQSQYSIFHKSKSPITIAEFLTRQLSQRM